MCRMPIINKRSENQAFYFVKALAIKLNRVQLGGEERVGGEGRLRKRETEREQAGNSNFNDWIDRDIHNWKSFQ